MSVVCECHISTVSVFTDTVLLSLFQCQRVCHCVCSEQTKEIVYINIKVGSRIESRTSELCQTRAGFSEFLTRMNTNSRIDLPHF